MMNLLILLIVYVPIIIITAITPYITRKTESFGVTIPSDMYNDERFRKFRSSYAKGSSLLGIALLIMLAVLNQFLDEQTWSISLMIATFAYIILTFFIYFHFHKKMKALKETEKWFEKRKQAVTIDVKFYQRKTTYSHAWFFIPFMIAALTLIFTLAFQDKFPDRMPMHYNFSGEVTDWADKSLGVLLMFPLMQFFLAGLFLFINYMISRSKQLIDPANPDESVIQNIIFRRRWSLFNIISGTILVILFALTQLSFVYAIDPQVLFLLTMLFTGIILIGSILLTIMTGQGGSRVRLGQTKSGEVIHRDEDRYWKLGIFYFNPDDPALWVEKRFGSGWTVNLARPLGWIIILGIIAIPLLIALLSQ